MNTKTIALGMVGLVFSLRLLAGDVPDSPQPPSARSQVYAADIEFLLSEFEQQAGHFFKVKGIDWAAVREQFRREALTVKSDADHVKLASRLLARLRDGHASLRDVTIKAPDESNGRKWGSPGVHLLASGDRVLVRQAYRGPAAQGVRIGTEVSRIGGLPAIDWLKRRVTQLRDETGYSTDHQALYAACHWGLSDWEGNAFDIEIIDGTEKKSLSLARDVRMSGVPVGPIHPPKSLRRTGRQIFGKTSTGYGYIHLRDIPTALPEQLDTMLEFIGDVPGLILDMRANGGGGCDHSAVFGRFLPTNTTWRSYSSAGTRPYGGPVVVIIDSGVRSAGETVAGMLKEDGRAYLIGDGPTAGTSSQKTTIKAPSGLFSAYFSLRTNMRRLNEGRGIEGIGIAPHEIVAYMPADLQAGIDTQIKRAEELLRAGISAGKVPFNSVRSATPSQSTDPGKL